MFIVSIDIGLYHLGLIGAQVHDNYIIDTVTDCKLVNIKEETQFCTNGNCKLHHELCMSDYISHFIQNYGNLLDRAEIILLEQQPPLGFISIQELIKFNYRNKTKMVSPCAMHAFFSIGHLSREGRKNMTVKMAKNYLEGVGDFDDNERQHDLCDAYMLMKFYLVHKHNEYQTEQELKNHKQTKVHKLIQSFSYGATVGGKVPAELEPEQTKRAASPT